MKTGRRFKKNLPAQINKKSGQKIFKVSPLLEIYWQTVAKLGKAISHKLLAVKNRN